MVKAEKGVAAFLVAVAWRKWGVPSSFHCRRLRDDGAVDEFVIVWYDAEVPPTWSPDFLIPILSARSYEDRNHHDALVGCRSEHVLSTMGVAEDEPRTCFDDTVPCMMLGRL